MKDIGGEKMTNEKRTISLGLELSDQTLGSHMGILVPSLKLKITNMSKHTIEVPESGLSMLLSLRVILLRGGHQLIRAAGVGEKYPITMEGLAPGESTTVEISPLDDGPGEVPLEPGTYNASVCITPAPELGQLSSFAERFGGNCSEPVELIVTPNSVAAT